MTVNVDTLDEIISKANMADHTAIRSLYLAYKNGDEKNEQKADFWLSKGVMLKEPFCLFIKADDYYNKGDLSNGLKYLKLSAKQGYAHAYTLIASMYYDLYCNHETENNEEFIKKCVKYSFLGLQHGDGRGGYYLSGILNKLPYLSSREIVANICKIAIKMGDIDSAVNLGVQYLNGKNGWPQDFKQSFYYLKFAADQKNLGGVYNLGVWYMEQKDYSNAIKYFLGIVNFSEDTEDFEIFYPFALEALWTCFYKNNNMFKACIPLKDSKVAEKWMNNSFAASQWLTR